MGLDLNFFKADKKIPFNRLNAHCLDLETPFDSSLYEHLTDVFYLRKCHDIHDLIVNEWRSMNTEDADKYNDNGLFIELTPNILRKIESFIYGKEEYEDFYNTVCVMLVKVECHKEVYYYEGDY